MVSPPRFEAYDGLERSFSLRIVIVVLGAEDAEPADLRFLLTLAVRIARDSGAELTVNRFGNNRFLFLAVLEATTRFAVVVFMMLLVLLALLSVVVVLFLMLLALLSVIVAVSTVTLLFPRRVTDGEREGCTDGHFLLITLDREHIGVDLIADVIVGVGPPCSVLIFERDVEVRWTFRLFLARRIGRCHKLIKQHHSIVLDQKLFWIPIPREFDHCNAVGVDLGHVRFRGFVRKGHCHI